MNIPELLISRLSILDSRFSTLDSRVSKLERIDLRDARIENRVETVNLRLSGTVDDVALKIPVWIAQGEED